ncbi:MAG: Tol-Pal system beta propeller repeat protein TolB [Alphaproteobacteria bacterium]
MKKIFLSLFLLLTSINISFAETLEISITEGEVKKTNIAISNFYMEDSSSKEKKMIANINAVITNNLKNSGLFEAIDKNAFMQKPFDMRFRPDFSSWRPINTEILITGKVININNKYKIEMYIWDVTRQKQILAKKYMISYPSWRRLSHLISDDIYTRITGETGYFDSRILFVSESKKDGRRIKRIAIMDQDGANIKYITNGKYIALTPRFSPDKKKIAYMSYKRGVPAVFLHDIKTGKIQFLGKFRNMTYAPNFSPDGSKMIFAYAEKGNSNIWEMNVETGRFRQITKNKHIDTSPAYAPDGESIVFTSDRTGSAQIHTLNLNSGVVKKISPGGGVYTTPVWSPRGDLIAYTKQQQGKFYIGVMNIDGTGERLISNSFLEEGPSFAPNGRSIVFSRNDISSLKTKLMSIDITGYNLREVKTPHGASDPNWSSLNKR